MKILTKVVIGTIALYGFAMNAHAADWKTAAGASCQSYFGSQEHDTNKQANGIYNKSANHNTWVSCSFPRDNVVGNRRQLVGLYVYVSKRTTCVSRSNRANGTAFQARVTTAGPGWVPLSLTLSASTGSYVAYCNLPPKGTLNTVLLYEYGNTTVR